MARSVEARAAGKLGKPSASSVSSSLVAVLKDEIKYEREAYRKDEFIDSGPPNEFEMQDVDGTSAFLLVKQFGNEEVVIRVLVDQQPSDYDEEEGEYVADEDQASDTPVEFTVTIGKDTDQVLTFEVESDGEYLTIANVSLESMDDDADGAPAYRGPVFQDLDDTLQQALVDYLEERGVNAYLGEYIRRYVKDKAAREYQQWLERMRKFVGR